MGKLAWYLFGEEEPAVASESVAVEAEPIADFKGFIVEAMREQEELEPECWPNEIRVYLSVRTFAYSRLPSKLTHL